MDTSVEVDSPLGNVLDGPKRVNNLGLMNEKQNYLIFSGVVALVGVILLVASKYYNKGDYSSSIVVLNQILTIEPTENKVLFNLACCHSLQHNKNALINLQNAIKFGYNDFKKIRVKIKDLQALGILLGDEEYKPKSLRSKNKIIDNIL